MQKTTNTDTWKKYDFHSHILPGMDHGCSDITIATEQIRRAAQAGICCIVATSHFYPHTESADSFLQRRGRAWQQLQKELAGEKEIRAAGIQIVPGAEVLVCRGLERMESLEELCVEGTRVLLLEMPFTDHWDPELIHTVTALRETRGLQVVLAHVERYRVAQIDPLLDAGCLAQVNAGSLTGGWNRQRLRAERYLRQNRISALGSDIHGVGDQYSDFARVMKKHYREVGKIMERTRELLS